MNVIMISNFIHEGVGIAIFLIQHHLIVFNRPGGNFKTLIIGWQITQTLHRRYICGIINKNNNNISI